MHRQLARKGFEILVLLLFLHGAQSACGGKRTGSSGIIDGMGSETSCTWNFVVGANSVVEFTFHKISFSTGTSDTLKLIETGFADLEYKANTGSPPSATVVYSRSNEFTITLTRASSTNVFFVSWRAVPDQCCSSYTVSGDNGAKILQSPLNDYSTVYTRNASLSTNNLTSVYVSSNGKFWMARMDKPYLRPWVLSTEASTPGWHEGTVFFGGAEDVCPRASSTYEYYDADPASPGFKIDSGKNILVACNVCSGAPPPAPAGSTTTAPTLPAAALTTHAYTCAGPDSFKLYSVCQKNGVWSAVNGACPDKPAVQLNFVLPNLNTVTKLTLGERCFSIRTTGWPTVPYKPNENLSWKFVTTEDCLNYKVSFDSRFGVTGARRTCSGDKISWFSGRTEVRKTCGNAAGSPVLLSNDGEEFRAVFTSDSATSGVGFMATICIDECTAR